MIQKYKKILHFKIALIILITVFLSLSLTVFLNINSFILIVLGVVFSLVAIFSLFMTLKPLDDILKGIKILASGNLSYRIDIRSQDELEQVASSFNFLAQTLKNATENLETDKSILFAEKNKLSLILSSVIDGIIALDGQNNVVLVNKAVEVMSGFSQKELERLPIDQNMHMFSENGEVYPKTYCHASFIQPLTLVGKNGKKVKINLIASNILGGVQTNLNCILILHDLTHEQELEQMKLDFVSMASHELKTPLTSIMGYLSVFINENKDKIAPAEIELLNRAEAASKQLSQLIENLLSVDKIERDQMTVTIQSIDYKSILEKAVEDLQNEAKQKNITLTLQSAPTLPKVMGDSVRMVEVINNLVSNAIHYTNPNGSISLYTKLNPTEVVTVIEDTGVGIPKEALPHLFTKFFRVSSTLQTAEKGTGLGLYISKSIIDKLGGRIWVESEVGRGTRFYFSLQIAPEQNLSNIDTQKFIGETIQMGGLNY